MSVSERNKMVLLTSSLAILLEPKGSSGHLSVASGFPLKVDMHNSDIVLAPSLIASAQDVFARPSSAKSTN